MKYSDVWETPYKISHKGDLIIHTVCGWLIVD